MYVVALFYLTTFLSNFPLARFTHKTSARNKQRVCWMSRFFASRRQTFPSPFLNMGSNLRHL